MNHVENEQALAQILKNLGNEAQTLETLWQGHPLLWQDLGWEQSQLKLWLYCQPNITQDTNSEGLECFQQEQNSEQDEPDLSEEIAKIVQSAGKQLPLAQLKNRLPAGLLATEPMLRAAISAHPHLKMMGPMVKLL